MLKCNISQKIAFLFLTKGNHNCEVAWNLFFKDIDSKLYNIYCHPKIPPTQLFLKNNVISTIIPTKWGDISLVKATLLLLKEAYSDPLNEYFIIVSDSCIPIINFNHLYKYLFRHDKSYLYWRHIDNRIDRYQKLSLRLKQSIPFNNFYSQHQWMIFIRKHVKIALKYNILSDFVKVHACDEHYFVTLFSLIGILKTECINHKTTYCDWSDKTAMHPTTFNNISNAIIDSAHRNNTFFIRKISKCYKLSEYLLFILKLTDS